MTYKMSRAPSRTNDVTVVVIFVKKLLKNFFLYGRLLLHPLLLDITAPRAAQHHGARESDIS